MEQIFPPKQNYKVLVRCFTYNQSKYINDALNGFAMQNTTFPFVCLVMDDCSTDGEQEVIGAWMVRECDMTKAKYIDLELSDVIVVPHKKNRKCTFAIYFLKRNLWKERDLKETLVTPWRDHAEYETICEGDDYWIAEDKLQKQVNVLDVNSKVGLCYSRYKVYNQDMQSFNNDIVGSDCVNFRYLLLHPVIGTLTTMFRISLYKRYYEDIEPDKYNWLMGDFPMWLYYSFNSDVKFLEEPMAVYRVLSESASHSKSFSFLKRCNESLDEIRKLYIQKYIPEDEDLLIQIEEDLNRRNFRDARYTFEFKETFKSFLSLKNKTINDYSLCIKFIIKYIYNYMCHL